jgi:hypothetical protein
MQRLHVPRSGLASQINGYYTLLAMQLNTARYALPKERDTPSALPRVVQAEGEHAAAGTADGEPIWDHEGDTPVRPSASIEGKARAPSSTDEVIA